MSQTNEQTPVSETETEKVKHKEEKLPNGGVSPDYTDADREGEGHGDERD